MSTKTDKKTSSTINTDIEREYLFDDILAQEEIFLEIQNLSKLINTNEARNTDIIIANDDPEAQETEIGF